jgi:hypothetical protein
MSEPNFSVEVFQAATAAAIDVIADGVAFAVIVGTQVARPVFPTDGRLALADAATRQTAS